MALNLCLAALLAVLASSLAAPSAAMLNSFTIDVRFVAPLSSQYQAAFTAAAARWSKVVTGTGADAIVRLGPNTPPLCFGEADSALPNGATFNDMLIFVKVVNIDGPGQVLGQSGICAYDRAPVPKPRVGWMELDLADVEMIYNRGQLPSVVLHEMGHILGIGSSWGKFGLTKRKSFNYRGQYGNAANKELGWRKQAIIENKGGAGTARVHWREAIYKNELMTGYISGATQPLSLLTVEALRDLGYSVDDSQADAFSATIAGTSPGKGKGKGKGKGHNGKRRGNLRGGADTAAPTSEDSDADTDTDTSAEDEEEKIPYHSPNAKKFGPPIIIDTVPAGGE